MKFLKSFNESHRDKNIHNICEEDIQAICKKYGIRNYTINEDGSIDVEGGVYIGFKDLTKIPLKFRNVTVDFYCYNNQLTSLKGCPKSISHNFDCSNNQLTSLEGCPESVGDNFYCNNNRITTFEHLPFSIGGNFYCDVNPIYYIWELFKDYSKIELFNYYDIIRDDYVIIFDRLKCFLDEIDVYLYDNNIKSIQNAGYIIK